MINLFNQCVKPLTFRIPEGARNLDVDVLLQISRLTPLSRVSLEMTRGVFRFYWVFTNFLKSFLFLFMDNVQSICTPDSIILELSTVDFHCFHKAASFRKLSGK